MTPDQHAAIELVARNYYAAYNSYLRANEEFRALLPVGFRVFCQRDRESFRPDKAFTVFDCGVQGLAMSAELGFELDGNAVVVVVPKGEFLPRLEEKS